MTFSHLVSANAIHSQNEIPCCLKWLAKLAELIINLAFSFGVQPQRTCTPTICVYVCVSNLAICIVYLCICNLYISIYLSNLNLKLMVYWKNRFFLFLFFFKKKKKTFFRWLYFCILHPVGDRMQSASVTLLPFCIQNNWCRLYQRGNQSDGGRAFGWGQPSLAR